MENYCVNGRVAYFQQQPHAKLGESSGSPSNTLNQSKIMVHYPHLTKSEPSTVVGKLVEILGEGGKIFISPANFAGKSRIFLDLKTADGQQGRIFCSPAVSKHLREKTMSASQLLGMPVVESTTKPDENGKTSIIYTVTLPGTELVELNVSEVKAWESAPVSLEELVDL